MHEAHRRPTLNPKKLPADLLKRASLALGTGGLLVEAEPEGAAPPGESREGLEPELRAVLKGLMGY